MIQRIPYRSPLLILVGVAAVLIWTAVAVAATAEPNSHSWKAVDQEEAKQRAHEVVSFVETVVDECRLCRQQKLRDQGYGIKDITHNYFLLDSPMIKKQEDHYGPVRFMHSKHAARIKDCALCHHYRPTDPDALETTRCSACHQEPFRSDHPERIGLKAAFHLQCMGCHKDMDKGPVDCTHALAPQISI